MIATRTLHIVIGSLSTRLSQPNRHIALNMLLKQVFVVLLFVMPNSMNGRDVSQQITASDINTVLNRLDSLVAKQKLIYEKREKKITEMETIHQVECTDSIKAYLALADSMRTYCIRYSLKYATQADKMAKKQKNDSLATEAAISLLKIYPKTGLIKELSQILNDTDISKLTNKQLSEFYINAAIAYAHIMDIYAVYHDVQKEYKTDWMYYYDKAIDVCSNDILLTKNLQTKYFFIVGDYYASADAARSILSKVPCSNELYGEAAQILARCYQARGKTLEQTYYQALAAISSVTRADRENMALNLLGNLICSDKRHMQRAHSYLASAIEFSPYRSNPAQTDILLNSINNINLGYREKWNNNMLLFWSLMVFVLLSLVLLAALLARNKRNLDHIKKEKDLATRANSNKESFMKNFLEMCVLSTERMNDLCRFSLRKITAKQIDDLYQYIRSGRIMDEQRKEFLRLFDKSFFLAFPTFVDELNQLLRPEEQYTISADQMRLPPELRVYAMIRLGITNVSRMAKAMGYSTNTLYVYRGKVKAKAANKQTFESDFARICTP